MSVFTDINFTKLIEVCLINICTMYANFKLSGIKKLENRKIVIIIVVLSIISITCPFVEKYFTSIGNIIYVYILITSILCIVTKIKFGYAMLVTIISLTINYVLHLIAVMICFGIYKILKINDYTNLFIIILVYLTLLNMFLTTKRLNKGLIFLRKYENNSYLDIVVLNISSIVLLTVIALSTIEENLERVLIIYIIIFSIIMFITIQKSLQLYYKQRMLVKDLEETKLELENKKKEVEALEKENLEFSKVSHSIAHKQKSLEHKLNELSMKSEIADELDIKDRIKNIDKDLREKTVVVLDKTGIDEIDDMLSYMQSECVKNKIDFQLQLNGNIYTMINHHIDKEDLEILLADHIKNAIIAIEYGDNVNKSILVRLGKLDGGYGLYIYDSGIEFEIGTLLNLGKKPSTTHKESGGTGMGFMNTFDTLRKHKASFVIEELGKPVKNNFTKVLKFKFDGKNEFKISSYRKEEIKNTDKDNSIVVEKLSL